jgi:hypothetical protein
LVSFVLAKLLELLIIIDWWLWSRLAMGREYFVSTGFGAQLFET